MKSDMKIFCVIPAYNERGNLPTLLLRLEKSLSGITKNYTILFVIQGTDGSRQYLEKIAKKHPNIQYLFYPHALGIGRAYQIGFSRVSGSSTYVLTLDADLNHDSSLVSQFIDEMEKSHADIVVGSRFIPGGQFLDRRIWKRFASSLVNRAVSTLLHTQVRDVTSGFRLMKTEVIKRVSGKLRETQYPYYMEFLLVAHRLGYKIAEVPITYTPRRWGRSKMGTLSTAYSYLRFFFRIISHCGC